MLAILRMDNKLFCFEFPTKRYCHNLQQMFLLFFNCYNSTVGPKLFLASFSTNEFAITSYNSIVQQVLIVSEGQVADSEVFSVFEDISTLSGGIIIFTFFSDMTWQILYGRNSPVLLSSLSIYQQTILLFFSQVDGFCNHQLIR